MFLFLTRCNQLVVVIFYKVNRVIFFMFLLFIRGAYLNITDSFIKFNGLFGCIFFIIRCAHLPLTIFSKLKGLVFCCFVTRDSPLRDRDIFFTFNGRFVFVTYAFSS